MTDRHHKIHYVELPARNLEEMKAFYSAVFGWSFTDYGASYCAFHGAGIEGGFDADLSMIEPGPAGVFVILYSDNLEATQTSIREAGGDISRATYVFPGGRRFHFQDTSGNELGVWTIA